MIAKKFFNSNKIILSRSSHNLISLNYEDMNEETNAEVIKDLKLTEFLKLLKAAYLDMGAKCFHEESSYSIEIEYQEEDSHINAEFFNILNSRNSKKINNSNSLSESSSPTTTSNIENALNKNVKKLFWISKSKGDFRLIRSLKNGTIKLIKRKGLSDNKNKANSICISNTMKNEFLRDVKEMSGTMLSNNIYEITRIIENPISLEMYTKWDNIINKIYLEGVNKN